MLSAIIRFSVRFRGVVIALACLVSAYGIYTLFESRLDVFPDFSPPLVVVQTEAPGLAPEQVETLVTQRVENALAGAIGLQSMRSQSIQGVSVVTLIFNDHTDVYRARQLVAEQLAAVTSELPQGVKPPAMTPLTSSTSIFLGIGLTSATRSLTDLRTFADWTVRPRLLAVPGVADVSVYGGEVAQFQVQVDPRKLVRFGVTLQEVTEAARRATGIRGAGFIENRNQRLVINTVGQSMTPAQLGQVVLLHRHGVSLRLADIGKVSLGHEAPVGGATVNGRRGVVLMVSNQFGVDLVSVTQAVERALKTVEPMARAEAMVVHPNLFRPADFVFTAIAHLRTSLLIGAALVVVVLFLFLFNARTAFISATAIPLALLAAVIVLYHFDIPLNTMTLGGLAIALGEVVDDAIVDVENIYRRLRENRVAAVPLSAARVVLDASVEVRGAVLYATFTVALVFLPVLGLTGVAGKLFAPLGIAYILAILSSLAIALTLTPALAYAMFAHRPLKAEEPWVYRRLKMRYVPVLLWVERHAVAVIVVLVIAVLASLAVLPSFSTRFLPELHEGHYVLHMQAAPGTSLEQSLRTGEQVSRVLLGIPGVRAVAQRVGRASRGIDVYGTHYSEFEVDLSPGLDAKSQERILAHIRATAGAFVGDSFSTETFLTERVQETISGYSAQVIVNVYGPDLDTLDNLARQVARTLNGIPGAAAVAVQAPPSTPQVTIRLRADRLARWGFAPQDVLEAVQIATQGAVVAQVYEGSRIVDVAVKLAADARRSPADLGALPLRSPDGIVVPLRDLADISQTDGRYIVLHSGGQRLQTVTANVNGPSVSAFVATARQRLAAQVVFPKGFYAVFSGEAQAQAQSQRDLLVQSGMAAIGIAMLLYMTLGSWRSLVLIMVNLPFALVGGVATVLVTGGDLSVGSMVGFVTLFGITLRNSIMLISHYKQLVERDGLPWGAQTAVLGATDRLAPILMTALVTGLGLLPLALQAGEPGNEVEGPMAVVILGGLITSTLLNLLVLPTLALRFGRFATPPAE